MRNIAVGLVIGMLGLGTVVGARTTVAVLYFDNNSLVNQEKYEGLRKGLCDMMITELSKMSGLQVVERNKLEKIMQEIALGQSGVVDQSTAPEVGKLLGADMLMMGSFVRDLGTSIRIDTRLVDVETGEVVKAEEVSGRAKKVFKLIKKLTFKVAEELSVSLSREERTRITKSDQVGFDALLVYSRGLELLDKGDTGGAREKFKAALGIDGDFDRAKAQLKLLEESE